MGTRVKASVCSGGIDGGVSSVSGDSAIEHRGRSCGGGGGDCRFSRAAGPLTVITAGGAIVSIGSADAVMQTAVRAGCASAGGCCGTRPSWRSCSLSCPRKLKFGAANERTCLTRLREATQRDMTPCNRIARGHVINHIYNRIQNSRVKCSCTGELTAPHYSTLSELRTEL